MFKEIMISVLFVALIFWSVILALGLSAPAKAYDNPSFKETIYDSFTYLKESFCDRNLFGIVLSSFVVFVSIPGFILALAISLFFEFCGLLVFIWKLGNKKES